MSISTRTSNLTSDASSSQQPAGWSDFEARINTFEGSMEQFMNAFVPSSATSPPEAPLRTPFSKFKPQPGQEVRSYSGLLSGLRRVTSRFPVGKRLTFLPNYREKLVFPFKAFEHKHRAAFPDIAVSFPGQALSKPVWKNIAAFVNISASPADDPFQEQGENRCRTLIQFAFDARGLMVAHGLLAAFILGVFGDTARIVRYDHSGIVASPAFSLRQQPELLREFFWRFVHPSVGDTTVGCDPTSRSLTRHELAWVQDRLQCAGKDPLQASDECRRVDVYSDVSADGSPARSQSYFFSGSSTSTLRVDGKLPDFPDCASRDLEQVIIKDAWRTLQNRSEKLFYDRLAYAIPEDEYYGLPRILCGGDLGELEAMQWRASRRVLDHPSDVPPQQDLLEDCVRVQDQVPHSPLSSAPLARSMKSAPLLPSPTPLGDRSRHSSKIADFGTDLTNTTLPSQHAVRVLEPPPQAHAPEDMEVPDSDQQPATFPLPYPQHQTFAWRVLHGDERRHRERSHMRFVVDTVGRPLTKFRRTREMVLAMRDAIRGHKLAWAHGKLLHRDVSVNNILIVDEPVDGGFYGFLHDFDYSYMEDLEAEVEDYGPPPTCVDEVSGSGTMVSSPRTGDVSQLRERTGTYAFLSIGLLKNKNAIHTVHDDLESFFWVLVWLVLRHTAYVDTSGDEKAYECTFVCINDGRSYAAKSTFLWFETEITVRGNAPLTQLMRKLRDLVLYHSDTHGDDKCDFEFPPFTHDTVLALFDEALALDTWPADDPALPRLDPALTRTAGNVESASKKRKPENKGSLNIRPQKRSRK
ncbi:hypothetical protein C8T65DRAFT_833988 [Cerioporus squamosus]|nr:hypothetical protein C8T65DRAFT_833988 [Cerioporus squamosus]